MVTATHDIKRAVLFSKSLLCLHIWSRSTKVPNVANKYSYVHIGKHSRNQALCLSKIAGPASAARGQYSISFTAGAAAASAGGNARFGTPGMKRRGVLIQLAAKHVHDRVGMYRNSVLLDSTRCQYLQVEHAITGVENLQKLVMGLSEEFSSSSSAASATSSNVAALTSRLALLEEQVNMGFKHLCGVAFMAHWMWQN